jgi:hypothetical protein
MDAYWHPVCPSCHSKIPSIAFPGNDRGPVRPQDYEPSSNMFCPNDACQRLVRLEACYEWVAERVWGSAGITPNPTWAVAFFY